MYEILVERTAERDLRALPQAIFNRIVSRPPGCHKLTGSRNDWRIRIGDYRVVYDIDDARRRVRIFRVRHRREVYR